MKIDEREQLQRRLWKYKKDFWEEQIVLKKNRIRIKKNNKKRDK